MPKKIKSTVDELETLPCKKKKVFNEDLLPQGVLLAEMIFSAMEEAHLSREQLAKLAGVSPTVIQSMRSGIKKDFSASSFLKILRALGCKIILERKERKITLDLALTSKG